MKDAKDGNWGLYRNDRLDMATHLQKEGKTQSALAFFLEVNYLDINGPNNYGIGRTLTIKEAAEFGIASWEPNSICASLTPGMVDGTWEAAEECGLDTADLRERFLKIASKHCGPLHLPVTPEAAWPKLREALEAYMAAQIAHEAAKEERRLQRQAERDARRGEKEAAKVIEREQKKAAGLAGRTAKNAEQAAMKVDEPQDYKQSKREAPQANGTPAGL